ncbi:hypothetical protein DDB_G0274151 [Dictyostelium discoideum AX4]|uniref:IPT/TIG domain-containing protein n=1 Tax=Dictyostelium discoideum TaxID=44689 RepID=Q86KE0_DICDI|nr:hypothetical protein DDB_G0274151 [Dictyostelium discoideum AX4]EAL69968.1 hypothetical protein DDB_G0274151 [Dictyostelium discoideum AX4]|eukprot:XP_644309.1 hypothetical protein DDB_G0274151 [Dictyostelium discoideum AX4]
MTPTLNSIKLPAGGNLGTQYPSQFMILGDNFDASGNGAEILYNGIVLTDCIVNSWLSSIPTRYACTIPSLVGSFVMGEKVASKVSNNITMWYDPPGIQSIFPVLSHSDSLLTIDGFNFEPYSKDKTIVTIDDNTLKPINGNTFKIFLNVGGQNIT